MVDRCLLPVSRDSNMRNVAHSMEYRPEYCLVVIQIASGASRHNRADSGVWSPPRRGNRSGVHAIPDALERRPDTHEYQRTTQRMKFAPSFVKLLLLTDFLQFLVPMSIIVRVRMKHDRTGRSRPCDVTMPSNIVLSEINPRRTEGEVSRDFRLRNRMRN
jgi:hypothetical protein